MKKNAFLVVMLGVALAFGLILAGCDNGTTTGGDEEITADPPKSNLYIGVGDAATLKSEAGTTLAENLEWLLDGNAVAGTTYTIELSASGSFGDIELRDEWLGAAGVHIILTTVTAAEVIIQLDANGRIFAVGDWDGGDDITLTLDGSVTLRGLSTNTSELVRVNGGGKLNLKGKAKITGNNSGGGVQAEDGGIITMSETAVISGNNGGGVRVRGTFTSFTMSGGEISGNTANDGGGVKVEDSAKFTMTGGIIKNNNGTWNGGGVRVEDTATFTMSAGTISGNKAREGGGVQVERGATFMMTGGIIDGNTSTYGGGGVFTREDAKFTMSAGTISGNTAAREGGGVRVERATFAKSGGTIYGSDGSATLKNTATRDGDGHAVQLDNNGKKLNTTVDPDTKLYAKYVSDDTWTYDGTSVGGVGEDTEAAWEIEE